MLLDGNVLIKKSESKEGCGFPDEINKTKNMKPVYATNVCTTGLVNCELMFRS
jgi:hypothetical protein